LFFDHGLDAQQFWRQFYLGFVPVFAAFGTASLFLGRRFLLACLFFLRALATAFSASVRTTCSTCNG
jgi:hypothetical protein